MSDATKAALDAALSAHVADESDGAMLTSYFVQASALPLESPNTSSTWYGTFEPDGQAFHVSLGLIQMAVKYATLNEQRDD